MKPKLKLPGTKHLKLKLNDLLLSFDFKFNLRRYAKGFFKHSAELVAGWGLHSSTFQLNSSHSDTRTHPKHSLIPPNTP
jgi:hypothetical protein